VFGEVRAELRIDGLARAERFPCPHDFPEQTLREGCVEVNSVPFKST
jgi:hypothetical protein